MTHSPNADWAANLDSETPLLVTGAAGFIGFHLSEKLSRAGLPVVGIDNMNDYYDPALKEARLDILRQYPNFSFQKLDLDDRAGMTRLFERHPFTHVINLAAQAGVRYSLENPHAYARSNLTGFLNLLEECRRAQVKHLVYASSSSVYGGNRKLPFSTEDRVDHPVSLYAATKKAGELMAHSYSHLYGIPSTGLRFFTVYGPWGRPDMAVYIFTKALFEGRPIQVFNHGEMQRDFTYIDDIIEGVARVIPMAPELGPEGEAAHRIFNIGNSRPAKLTEMIALLEELTGHEAIKEMREMQPGDVRATYAEVTDLEAAVGFRPDTPLREGLARFVAWYRDYHRV
ncbi:MAG: NAD-dependent epimerase [Paracoccaceae bacterium]|nr:NAD-dependent epimerase [Paracoccaceae bacterium]